MKARAKVSLVLVKRLKYKISSDMIKAELRENTMLLFQAEKGQNSSSEAHLAAKQHKNAAMTEAKSGRMERTTSWTGTTPGRDISPMRWRATSAMQETATVPTMKRTRAQR